MDIKIEAQTVVANEGGFEPHPESYTPRVFCIVNPQWGDVAIYEILQNGQAILWPNLPNSNSFDCWLIYVSSLNKVDMHRVPKKTGFGPSTQKAIDNAQVAHRQYQQDPVPQADGDCPNPDVCGCGQSSESGTPSWIGEIDGKRYSGLGKPESGWAVTHMWRLWFDGVAPSDTPKSLRRTVIDWLRAL